MISFEDLPNEMRNNEVLEYYNILKNKQYQLFFKRFFDIIFSFILCILFSPIMILVSIAIKLDSKGPVFFRQKRLTTNRKVFKILKFRTMIDNSYKSGSFLTSYNDLRITKIGKILRKFRIDEIPQLFNIILGDMSFVGTRPEVLNYIISYTDEMNATFLMPAGLTSLASIKFKDEVLLLKDANNVDLTYINEVLPQKMKYNLLYIKEFSFLNDIALFLKTFFEVF